MMQCDGEAYAQKSQADYAIIGYPDDESWNEPDRFTLYDEDQPGVHRTLMARTRLGEDSAVAVPIFPADDFAAEHVPSFLLAKRLFSRALNLSRKGVVRKLKDIGVPDGWKRSSMLRNCFPLILDDRGRWTEDVAVKLDDELGLIYEIQPMEVQ